MPPNPPSNSRLPRLAVWSSYGTVFYIPERPRIQVQLTMMLISICDSQKSLQVDIRIACVQTSPISFVATKEIGDVCTQANIRMTKSFNSTLPSTFSAHTGSQ